MLKKTITYENPFTEQEVTEEHYFHISKADLVQMEMEEHNLSYQKDGKTLTGMEAKLQKIIDSQDGKAILLEIKDMIRRAYGIKDGDRFLKSPQIWENFSSTEAFSQLLFELCTDANAAADFMNGITPNNIDKIADEVREKAAQAQAVSTEIPEAGPTRSTTTSENGVPAPKPSVRVLSEAEMRKMDSTELQSGLAEGRYKLSQD